MSLVIGKSTGSKEGEWAEFYVEEYGVTLDVKVRPTFPKDLNRIRARYVQKKRRGGQVVEEVPKRKRVDHQIDLFDHIIADWGGDGRRGPRGEFCSSCDELFVDEELAQESKLHACRCDDPEVVEREIPCESGYKHFVINVLPAGFGEDVGARSRDMASNLHDKASPDEDDRGN